MTSADDFQDVVRVFGQSLIARSIGRTAVVVQAAAARSFAARLVERVRYGLTELSTGERLRVAAALLLTATVVQGLLMQLVSALVRPAAPRLLRVELAVAAVVLIVAAPQLARAWPESRVRRFTSRWFGGAQGSSASRQAP